jgi:molecular chaperone GrpE
MQDSDTPRPPSDEMGDEPETLNEAAAAAADARRDAQQDGAFDDADDVPDSEIDAGLVDEEYGDPRDQQIVELQKAFAEARDQQLRALAEAENIRRRSQREREDSAKYGAVGLARDLLNVADNLRRALDAAPDPGEDSALKSLIEGITLVEKELGTVFERHHVRPVPGVGEPFDHNLHQAVIEMPTADIEPGNVAQVLQSGYVLHDRLLRASMVAVAKAPE